MLNDTRITDAFTVALARASALVDGVGLVGYGVAELWTPDGLEQVVPFANLVTTPGDQYYAQKGVAGVGPLAPAAPTAMNGMKLGTGTTAAAKSGAGGSLVTYLAASNVAFDAGYAVAAAVTGTDTGWTAGYKTTWAAGTATNAAITEVAIVNDQATNATSSAANTISRAVFTAINKGALDSLAITWLHKFLGA